MIQKLFLGLIASLLTLGAVTGTANAESDSLEYNCIPAENFISCYIKVDKKTIGAKFDLVGKDKTGKEKLLQKDIPAPEGYYVGGWQADKNTVLVVFTSDLPSAIDKWK